MSDSFRPYELQHTGLPCSSLSPRVCSGPLSWWCHPNISSSTTSFSSCPQSFPASGSFPMSWLFTSGGQSTGASASASVLLVLFMVDFLSKRLSKVFSSTTVQKHQFSVTQTYLWSNFHICTWLLEKPWLWLYISLSAKGCLCFLIHYLGLSYLFFHGASVF